MDKRVDLTNPNLGFSGGQSTQLQNRCKKLRGGSTGGSSGGLGTGWIFFQPWICGSEGCGLGAGTWVPDIFGGGGNTVNVLR